MSEKTFEKIVHVPDNRFSYGILFKKFCKIQSIVNLNYLDFLWANVLGYLL